MSPPRPVEQKIPIPAMSTVSTTIPTSASNGITAADLLSNIKGLPRLPPPSNTYHHVRMPSAPTAPLSFGPNGPISSIWSDDHSRQYTANAKTSGSLLSGSAFPNMTSQLPTPNTTIGYAPAAPWSSSPSTQTSNSTFIHSSPTTAYNSQPLPASFNPIGTQNLAGGHNRMPSESAFLPRSQLYQSTPANHRYDALRSPLPIGDQVNVPSRGLSNLPPNAFADTIYSASPGASFNPRDTRDQYGHSLQSRGLNMDRTYTAPFISSSSIWGHPG